MLSSTSLFKYEPIQQFRADQSGFFADEARRRNAETQRAIGTAVAKAASAPTKPKFELVEVDRNPALTALSRSQVKPLEEAITEQQKLSRALRQRQQSLLPQLEAITAQDVSSVGTGYADYLRSLDDITKGALDLTEASRKQAMLGAAGEAERYGAGRPNQGLSSEMLKILGTQFAQAQLPYDLQRQQIQANQNEARYRALQGTLGQRQSLLARDYGLMSGMSNDVLQPLTSSIDAIRRLADAQSSTVFQDVGGETMINPRPMPFVPQRSGYPRFNMSYTPQLSDERRRRDKEDDEDKPPATRRIPPPTARRDLPYYYSDEEEQAISRLRALANPDEEEQAIARLTSPRLFNPGADMYGPYPQGWNRAEADAATMLEYEKYRPFMTYP